MPCRVPFLLAFFSGAAADLTSALLDVQFLHSGVVNATSVFSYGRIPCGYLEAENVTSYLSGWGEGGKCPYLFQSNSSSPPQPCAPSPISANTDMPGNDLDAFPVASDNVTLCEAQCCSTADCVAWVYAPSAPAVFLKCNVGDHCCYMKSTISSTVAKPGLSSGTNGHEPLPNSAIPPPIGMRSAVPLGGLGAGSFELRGDGTFHEITIHNAHPAGGAKYGVLADAMLGVRVSAEGAATPVTRAVRTAPPPYAATEASASLAYSGTYPVSRLQVIDDALANVNVDASVYAYSVFKPGSETEFAHPAVTFTLVASNRGTTPATASLYFALPWGAINDCDRTGNASTVSGSIETPDALTCLAACAATPANCSAWTWAPLGAGGGGTCTYTFDAPWPRFRAGFSCAVAGMWSPTGDDALTFIADANQNAKAKNQPGVGDVTIRAVDAESAAYHAGEAGALWSAFASGNFPRAPPLSNATTASVGAMVASVTVPPGGNASVSIVFAWHFPHKDWWHEEVSNFYANLWTDSTAVAEELAVPGRLAAVVDDINTHHLVFLGPPPSSALPPSPIPAWLRDSLANQFSHFRSMHYLGDGRMRMYEAPDCPDVDSVHNDYQRHLIYNWAASKFELSKFEEYVVGQLPDGHIPEFLGGFSLGP